MTYDGELNPDSIMLLAQGIDIGEKKRLKPAKLELISDGSAYLTISEGKYHQVKRMIAKMGGRVTALKRVEMAGIPLDETLKPGEFRRLTEQEIEQLRQNGV